MWIMSKGKRIVKSSDKVSWRFEDYLTIVNVDTVRFTMPKNCIVDGVDIEFCCVLPCDAFEVQEGQEVAFLPGSIRITFGGKP